MIRRGLAEQIFEEKQDSHLASLIRRVRQANSTDSEMNLFPWTLPVELIQSFSWSKWIANCLLFNFHSTANNRITYSAFDQLALYLSNLPTQTKIEKTNITKNIYVYVCSMLVDMD